MTMCLSETIISKINIIFSISISLGIIYKLYVRKKFNKTEHFHLYNDLFSWEIYFFIMAAINIIQIISIIFHQHIVGFFSCQFVCFSYIRAIRSNLSSVKVGDKICRPIGNSFSSKPHGTLIPGMPAKFAAMV